MNLLEYFKRRNSLGVSCSLRIAYRGQPDIITPDRECSLTVPKHGLQNLPRYYYNCYRKARFTEATGLHSAWCLEGLKLLDINYKHIFSYRKMNKLHKKRNTRHRNILFYL